MRCDPIVIKVGEYRSEGDFDDQSGDGGKFEIESQETTVPQGYIDDWGAKHRRGSHQNFKGHGADETRGNELRKAWRKFRFEHKSPS